MPRKTGTLNAPYDQDGSLTMWEDTEIETRLHMKQFYGVRGEGRLFDSICALPAFQKWSPEELRHQDYADGRKGEAGQPSQSEIAGSGTGDELDPAAQHSPVEIPLLLYDILKRLKHYLTFTLRPGLCVSLRQVTEAASLLDLDGSVKAALERSAVRLAAGDVPTSAPTVPDDCPSGETPAAEENDATVMAGLGLRVRVKQSKQKQLRKQQQQQEPSKHSVSSSGAGHLAAQQAQKERDEQILKYAGFENLGVRLQFVKPRKSYTGDMSRLYR